MSKNISVKINNGNTTIETVKLNSANQKVIIKAQSHVNYELVDETTQYAPEMIDTKRVGNDLYIAFEGTDINKESDLVLEGYYEHDNTELVLGMAEDGQYYAYVPQSGVESDAVTLLADQVFAPQALGGNSVTAPFWAFNPNWLWVAAGVAAVGGIIAAASGSHGGGSSNNAADKPSDNSDKNNGAVLDNANNNGNTAKDSTAPAKPTVEAKMNGFVYITPPANAKSVEVHYIDEKGNPQTVTITKDADKGWVSSNPDNIWLNSETGKITLLAHKVKGGSLVKASATDNQGNTSEASTENAVNILDTYGPTMPDLFHLQDGSLLATMPIEAEVGDSVVIKRGIYKEHNWDWDPHKGDIDSAETLATLTKQQDGSWISDKPENVPNVDAGNDNTIIPANKLKGFENVYVYAIDPAGNQSRVELTYIGNNLYNKIGYATITVKTDGFVEISPPSTQDLKLMKVSYTDKAGTRKITSLTKGEDGNWTSDNPDVMVEPVSGKAMISADKIQGGSKVYVNVFDNSGMNTYSDQTVGKNPDITAPSAPEVIPSITDGSVTVKVPDDAKVGDTVEVRIVPETSVLFLPPEVSPGIYHLSLTKNADGSWTSSDTTRLPNIEAGQNSTTIPQYHIKDGSNVTAQANNSTLDYSALVTAQAGEDTKDPDEAGVSSNTIDSNGMGSSGNDYASFEQISGTINMGAGNDILEARSTEMPFFFAVFNANIDMGSGDDIVRTSGAIQDNPVYKEISIDGGDDFDTFEFVNRDGKEIITTISALSNFEKIDIKGTLNNTINIQKYDVERNHNDKPTVDDSGQSHNNVLIVDGDEGDKVNLNDISEVASSQVNYKGNTYHVYHTGSNELWIDSDIAVA